MDNKKFTFWNRITAAVVFVVSAVTYLATIEPTASFWDCGEFIASSYKLEVGHPPGNPVFQLLARIFTMFGDNMHAAMLVNACSAICSALTILLLYLTIVFFVKRLVAHREDGSMGTGEAIAVMASGVVGGLAYAFSDTFWFSAVEAEVYAMSSLLTALVFYLMTKWYEQADEPNSGRWIVLICFVMGLSIGVHLLNLLAAPALVYLYYYRKREDSKYTFRQLFGIMALSAVILFILVFIFIPYLPKVAAYFDLFFVNTLGTSFNVGAVFFMVLLFGGLFAGMYFTYKKGKAVANMLLMCVLTICLGFSLFSIDVIRSIAKTPTNEYQPDNAFTLVRYLSREQYGSTPLVYGQYFDASYSVVTDDSYWAPMPQVMPDGTVKDRYEYVPSPVDVTYKAEDKMLFPRMWNPGSGNSFKNFYEGYYPSSARDPKTGKVKMEKRSNPTGRVGERYPKPSFATNMAYFLDYQMHWMYWRYFMWNFAGRQNDVHSPSPGNRFYGNWESGVTFIDNMRLGDQSDAPEDLAANKGKNHYFFLPLLLGLIGLFFQFDKDKRGSWLVFLLFFMTGIAIVLYLNQPPMQVRERDYAYAGSFYAFSIWIGIGVAALYSWIKELIFKEETAAEASAKTPALAVAVSVLCLGVPTLMAAQNWDDHDRSNRYTAVEMAYNYLNSVGENGILVTHGDNDTFPLWYAQEVESCRTDVRICNTSLLGTDWHIDQMRYAVNESAPLSLSIGHEQYLYGTNDFVYVVDINGGEVMELSEAIKIFKDKTLKMDMEGNVIKEEKGKFYDAYTGKKVNIRNRRDLVDFFPAKKVSVPVNKENVLAHGILSEKYADMIPDEIVFSLPNSFGKPDLFMLDLISGYDWDRPLHLLNNGGDISMGIKPYLLNVGFSSVFTPLRWNDKKASYPVDTDRRYETMTRAYSFDKLSREDYYIDYQNKYTFMGVVNVRNVYLSAAIDFYNAGEYDRAEEMLDMGLGAMKGFPLSGLPISFAMNDSAIQRIINVYYMLSLKNSEREEEISRKADELALRYWKEIAPDMVFFMDSPDMFALVSNLTSNFISIVDQCSPAAVRDEILSDFQERTGYILGSTEGDMQALRSVMSLARKDDLNAEEQMTVSEYSRSLYTSMEYHYYNGDDEHMYACYSMGLDLHDVLDSAGKDDLSNELARYMVTISDKFDK